MRRSHFGTVPVGRVSALPHCRVRRSLPDAVESRVAALCASPKTRTSREFTASPMAAMRAAAASISSAGVTPAASAALPLRLRCAG